jgi:hypothetical protein
MSIDGRVTSEPQHLRALEHANRVRLARAELKRRIAAGEVHVPDVVLESPWEARSMELSELLMSQKRWGRERCRRLLIALAFLKTSRSGRSLSASAPRWPRCLPPRLPRGARRLPPSRLLCALLLLHRGGGR